MNTIKWMGFYLLLLAPSVSSAAIQLAKVETRFDDGVCHTVVQWINTNGTSEQGPSINIEGQYVFMPFRDGSKDRVKLNKEKNWPYLP